MVKFVVVLFAVLLSAVACGGDSDLKKQATQTAIQLDQANSAAASQQRAMLVVTHKSVMNNPGYLAMECDRAGINVDCGNIQWQDSFGVVNEKHVWLDSQCWTDVAIGYDLPESCRR